MDDLRFSRNQVAVMSRRKAMNKAYVDARGARSGGQHRGAEFDKNDR
jgi:hypothetical protein